MEIILKKSNNEGAWSGESEPFVKAYPSHIKMENVIKLHPSIKLNIFCVSVVWYWWEDFMSEWNSIRGKSNRMINVTFVAIIKFIKVGRVWSPFDWYLLQRHPCPDPTLCPSPLVCWSKSYKKFTTVPKYDVVFSLCGHPPRHLVIEFLRSINRNVFVAQPPPLTLTDRQTFPLYLFVLVTQICQPSLQQGGPGINGYGGGLCDHLGVWVILVSGWHVITPAVNQDRHRAPDTERLRRADTEGSRQLWGDLKQCGDWDIIYWYRPAVVALKTFSIIFWVSEVSIMSTRWNSFKWIFYLARIFRQSLIKRKKYLKFESSLQKKFETKTV